MHERGPIESRARGIAHDGDVGPSCQAWIMARFSFRSAYQDGLDAPVAGYPPPQRISTPLRRPPSQGGGLGTAVVVGLVGWWLWDAYKSKRRSERVQFGFDREVAVANNMQRRGASVAMSPGSRGPFDVFADWGRTSWAIQLKASRDGEPRLPGPRERDRLVRAAEREGAVPVIGLASGQRTTYHHAVTGERLRTPRR